MAIEDASAGGSSGRATRDAINGSSVTLDHNHPLYLSSSDVPGALSIGIQLTGMENYTIWSRAMEIALLGRNKLGFIDGSVLRIAFEGELKKIWDRCNAIVISWLTYNVSKELLSGILYSSSAHQVWIDLKERFDKVNGSRLYQLHRSIFTLTQGVLSVSAYYTKLKNLWDEYDSILPPPSCDCSKSMEYVEQMQYQRLLQFMMGLNDSYSQARGQILMMHTLPNVNQAYALVIQDECQKGIAGNINEGMESLAMYTNRTSRPQQFNNRLNPRKNYQSLYCDFCNMKGHVREDCNKLKKCDHCHTIGHVKENCYLLIGYPENFKGRKKVNAVIGGGSVHSQQQDTYMQVPMDKIAHTTATGQGLGAQDTHEQWLEILHKSSPQQLQQMLETLQGCSPQSSVNMAVNSNSHLKWIIDTGASDHMINNPHYLINENIVKSRGKVQLPTGESAIVSHIGSVQLNECDMINEVLCIPTFKFNLLSVHKLTKELNCYVSFFPTHCVFQDLLSGKVKGIGRVEDGLYVMHWPVKQPNVKSHTMSAVKEGVTDPGLWHKRLGHVPMGVLRRINEFKTSNSFTIDHCIVCPQAR